MIFIILPYVLTAQVRANTVVDDKDLLIKANAEIARLKILLRQALRNNEKGINKNDVVVINENVLNRNESKDNNMNGIGTGTGTGMNTPGLSSMNINSGSGSGGGSGNNSSGNNINMGHFSMENSRQASFKGMNMSVKNIKSNSNNNSNNNFNNSNNMSGNFNNNFNNSNNFNSNNININSSNDNITEQNNEITLQLFEENEKLKKENLKMRQALEWSIKLSKKKKSAEVEFDNAPIEDINQYKFILNSIDLSPSIIGSTLNSLGNTRNFSSSNLNLNKSGDELLPSIRDGPAPPISRGVSFQGLGQSNRDLLGFKSNLNDRKMSAGGGSGSGTGVNGVNVPRLGTPGASLSSGANPANQANPSANPGQIMNLNTILNNNNSSTSVSFKKKKKRGKSLSLPSLFRTEKELDYLEYINNVHNNIKNPGIAIPIPRSKY